MSEIVVPAKEGRSVNVPAGTVEDVALELARQKVGATLVIEDIVIQNIAVTKELERAIEQKMVQEQEAAKAKFIQQRADIEADTAVIKAKGDAESIKIRGEALKQTPAFIDLQIVEKWDGKAPLVIGGTTGGGVNMLLPLADLQKQRTTSIPTKGP